MRWRHMLRPGGHCPDEYGQAGAAGGRTQALRLPGRPHCRHEGGGTRVIAFDATTIALDLGDIRLGNTVMLGAIADHLPFSADVLQECVLQRFRRKGEQVVDQNRRAFEAGRAAVGEAQMAAA